VGNLFLSRGCGILLACVVLLGSGCGLLRRAAIGDVAEVFSGPSGSNVFVRDDDPELIRDALPFALKTYEALLASDPKNIDLRLRTAGAFVRYANAFVHEEAKRLEALDLQRAQYLRRRATKLYLRGRNYALAGLMLDYPDFENKLRDNQEEALRALSEKDVPFLFWAAAGWAGAISTDVNNMSLVAELPCVEAMMRRALELDQDFEDGAIHEFFISYEGGRSEAVGGNEERAMAHFDGVVRLTGDQKASPYVLLASSVAVRKQDDKMFRKLLHKALVIDPDGVPKWRLANILAQEKALWLLDHGPELFLNYEEAEP
jgi:predicted anti-sigma-YlaC factor YlaD